MDQIRRSVSLAGGLVRKIQFREQVLDATNNPIRALVTKRRIIPLLPRIRVEQLLAPDLVVCGVLLALAKDHPSG